MQSTRNFVEIETGRGRIKARAAIVTVSTAVLAAEKIKFKPALPKRQLDAIAKLSLGSYDHVALELKGNPLQLRNDDLVFEKATGARTAALLANVSGTPLCDGRGRRQVRRANCRKAGEAAMIGFRDRLARRPVRRRRQEGDRQDPRDALERRAVGAGRILGRGRGRSAGRKMLMEPVRERLFFAGEAVHETLWGTVGGAWESGERAADAALRLWGRR